MDRREVEAKKKIVALSAMVLNKLLKSLNCEEHYRVEILPDGLRIRESTQNPPIQRRKERFEAVLKVLESHGIFKFSDHRGRGLVGGHEVDISYKTMSKVNVAKLFEFLGLSATKKPENVDEHVWASVPKEIQSRWERFTPEMQEYIVTCCSENAEKNIADLLDTKLITDSKRSPISMDVPKIPVRLPNKNLKNGVSNEVYDLTELINIKQRDPKHPELRADPITRNFFDLREVIPAKEAREAIIEKGMQKGPM